MAGFRSMVLVVELWAISNVASIREKSSLKIPSVKIK